MRIYIQWKIRRPSNGHVRFLFPGVNKRFIAPTTVLWMLHEITNSYLFVTHQLFVDDLVTEFQTHPPSLGGNIGESHLPLILFFNPPLHFACWADTSRMTVLTESVSIIGCFFNTGKSTVPYSAIRPEYRVWRL